uniref:Uncharacterized protein n=1 Tax=Glossina pallidipes TaxID=7398 RepID=A0A1A9Z1T9_GLOPL
MSSFHFRFKPGNHGCPDGDMTAAANYAHLLLCCIILNTYQTKARSNLNDINNRKIQRQEKRRSSHNHLLSKGASLHRTFKSNTSLAQRKKRQVSRAIKWIQRNCEQFKKFSSTIEDAITQRKTLQFITTVGLKAKTSTIPQNPK